MGGTSLGLEVVIFFPGKLKQNTICFPQDAFVHIIQNFQLPLLHNPCQFSIMQVISPSEVQQVATGLDWTLAKEASWMRG